MKITLLEQLQRGKPPFVLFYGKQKIIEWCASECIKMRKTQPQDMIVVKQQGFRDVF